MPRPTKQDEAPSAEELQEAILFIADRLLLYEEAILGWYTQGDPDSTNPWPEIAEKLNEAQAEEMEGAEEESEAAEPEAPPSDDRPRRSDLRT